MSAASEEAREDRDYWNDKYDEEPECEFHGADEMYYDTRLGEWYCGDCDIDNEWRVTENYG